MFSPVFHAPANFEVKIAMLVAFYSMTQVNDNEYSLEMSCFFSKQIVF